MDGDNLDAVDLWQSDASLSVANVDSSYALDALREDGEFFYNGLVGSAGFRNDIVVGQVLISTDPQVELALSGLGVLEIGEVQAYAVVCTRLDGVRTIWIETGNRVLAAEGIVKIADASCLIDCCRGWISCSTCIDGICCGDRCPFAIALFVTGVVGVYNKVFNCITTSID